MDLGRVDSLGFDRQDRPCEHRHEDLHGQIMVLFHVDGRVDEHAWNRSTRRLEHRRAVESDQSGHLRHVRSDGHRSHLSHLAHPFHSLFESERECLVFILVFVLRRRGQGRQGGEDLHHFDEERSLFLFTFAFSRRCTDEQREETPSNDSLLILPRLESRLHSSSIVFFSSE